ncbi:hypothetical protein SLS60_005839 [Paraconiothyrium brasiliense]|uniref:HD/PDEase domain-containing protein n=1 Tax=Paraconiothyrium brasiliense TaxID=300254 RepID=A0ABR3RDC6_9PLEO
MPSELTTFASRLRTFIQQLPHLWASTHPTNTAYASSLSPDPTLPGGYADSPETRNRLLFNMDKLSIPHPNRPLFLAVNKLVLAYMSSPRYDPSHDYEHIQRVVKYTHELYVAEKAASRLPPNLDLTTMYLAAMMHDVGETKYLEAGRSQTDVVREKMLACGATSRLAEDVATIAVNVSYTREATAKDKTLVYAIMARHPELAFVQDADRLDAIGPCGQARCFVYGGANETRRGQSIHTGVQLHHTRFCNYVGMMKTGSGREKAVGRWEWMGRFRREWGVDTDVSSVL